MITELHVTALLAYGLAAGSVGVPLLRLKEGRAAAVAPRLLVAGAVGVHFAALLSYAWSFRAVPLMGFAPALSSLAFLIGLLALAIQQLTRETAFPLLAGPLAAVLLAVALAAGFGQEPVTETAGVPFVLHAGASLLGLALLVIAAVAAVLYLLQHRQLKGRRFGTAFRFLPALEHLDRLNLVALEVGFPVMTAGILLAVMPAGLLREFHPGAAHLGWGLASWIVIGSVAAARVLGWVRGRRAAVASIAGFAAVLTAYVVLAAVRVSGARFL